MTSSPAIASPATTATAAVAAAKAVAAVAATVAQRDGLLRQLHTGLATPGRRRKKPPSRPPSGSSVDDIDVDHDDDATFPSTPHKRARTEDTCEADQFTRLLTEKPAVGITEVDVGITQYLGLRARFSGVLKQRYTDFCVNEITRSGEVLHVQHLPVKARPLLPQLMEEEYRKEGDFDIDEVAEQQIAALLGDECILSLREVAKSGGSYETKKPDGKDERANVHQLIRVAYNGKINSKTTTECTLRFSRLTGNSSRNRRQDLGRRNQALEPLDPMVVDNMGSREAFTHFSVFKESQKPRDARHIIAKFLHTKPKLVTNRISL